VQFDPVPVVILAFATCLFGQDWVAQCELRRRNRRCCSSLECGFGNLATARWRKCDVFFSEKGELDCGTG
jgi:hypothetical protein